MSVQPAGKVARIEWSEERIAKWNLNAVGMGSTAPEVTAWQAKVEDARAKYLARQEAKNAAKTATNDFRIALNAMTNATADIIKQVKSKAAISGDGIYSLADIPVPAVPSPTPPPGMPYGFVATLLPNGSLEITWKCDNPPRAIGTIYAIWRKNADGSWNQLGGAGQKKFIDTTVPAGVPSVIYSVQAMRSTGVGVSNEFTVNFGVASGGGMTATVSAPKLAA
jgi:hypothetical protein